MHQRRPPLSYRGSTDYCDGTRNISAKIEPRYIVGSILRQLWELLIKVEGSHCTIDLIGRLQEQACRITDSQLIRNNSFSLKIFSRRLYRDVYIAIDGIDECCARAELCRIAIRLASLRRQRATMLTVVRMDGLSNQCPHQFLCRRPLT